MSWYPDDKTWLKARKAQWKEVKESLKEMYVYEPKDVKLIKEYFLYGPDKEPMRTVNNDGGVKRKISYMDMVSIWLYPSFDKESIIEELHKFRSTVQNQDGSIIHYDTGAKRVLEFCDRDYATHESATDNRDTSFFQGKEQLLAELLFPSSVEEESWFKNSLRDGDEDRLKAKCERSFRMAINRLSSYFSKHMENPNPNFIYRYRLSYCISALKHFKGSEFEAQSLKENLVTFFAALEKITASPDDYPQCFVETAQEFTRLFNEADLPDSVHALLAPYIKAAKEGTA
ncbi:hypothetical protein [Pseudoalteromonas ruthenica]|uniref:hypothetical protein n=1 Tax=Pseudoalteromonas ruthenica TaxID=151081 RepID=UPI00241C376A|nr:hypothetical protein [Pseudoalteromonas ruthenica]|tara:strand:+ start:121574 stop:122434 length:861 start_codon:yes stop_codon:yes gene_type:complete